MVVVTIKIVVVVMIVIVIVNVFVFVSVSGIVVVVIDEILVVYPLNSPLSVISSAGAYKSFCTMTADTKFKSTSGFIRHVSNMHAKWLSTGNPSKKRDMHRCSLFGNKHLEKLY